MIWVWLFAGLFLIWAVFTVRNQRRATRKGPDGATILLREEQLKLTKTREHLADVTTRKEVHRDVLTISVPITKEDLVVEKNGVAVARIPLREDQVDLSTRSVPLNEVSIYEREWEENREIQAMLKKEVVRIETTGEVQYAEQTPEQR